ncbi:MAG: 4-hydroxy-3-methylbut-2-enyl diphosphate reductase [Candidatus Melainabacteria bacterium GWF2_37_15]|nr:MAG: 4-hydroxy-3-methylbut-2-enyl diphosphate reductase [Candidatus Melainabacteria bacterium GWF2_37_15]
MTTAINYEKDIKLAKLAGFCYGVKRAVEESIRIKKENPETPVYILGKLIHNNQVSEHLESLGIHTLTEIPEILEGICIIRTHGATPQTKEELEKKGCKVVDLTCPDVKRVQDKAKALAKDGYKVIVIGKADHPEVMAIKAHADQYSESLVISSMQEVEKNIEKIRTFKKIGVVIQTTQLVDNFKQIIPLIGEHSKELKVYNTICDATFERQKAAQELASTVDLMIVVGSKESANTTHLTEILKPVKNTLHIESKEELKKYRDLIINTHKIGITAGASTPDFVIREVINEIGKIGEKTRE